MDRPQDMEGARTSIPTQVCSQSSCPPFLGESHDLIVPPGARILHPRSLEDIDNMIKELKAEFDRHTLDAHTPRPSQYIWIPKIPQHLFTQIETDLELFSGACPYKTEILPIKARNEALGVISSQEPDWAFGPYDARVDSAADEYPSLVLEIGASESLDQLR
ncbi:hypothetical protein AAEP93_002668 [Penicillium crustosum]